MGTVGSGHPHTVPNNTCLSHEASGFCSSFCFVVADTENMLHEHHHLLQSQVNPTAQNPTMFT
jgi:hypothetical protein